MHCTETDLHETTVHCNKVYDAKRLLRVIYLLSDTRGFVFWRLRLHSATHYHEYLSLANYLKNV